MKGDSPADIWKDKCGGTVKKEKQNKYGIDSAAKMNGQQEPDS